MAFTSTDLTLLAHGKDNKLWFPDANNTRDTLATVQVSGYYNNTDDNVRLSVGDEINVYATDGHTTLFVSAVSSGAVTTKPKTSIPVIAHGGTTSVTLDAQGVVTVSPTSDAMGLFKLAAAPTAGEFLRILNISTTTSASAQIAGATTSVESFGLKGNKTIELFYGGAVTLLAVSTSVRAIVGTDYLSSTSITGTIGVQLSN